MNTEQLKALSESGQYYRLMFGMTNMGNIWKLYGIDVTESGANDKILAHPLASQYLDVIDTHYSKMLYSRIRTHYRDGTWIASLTAFDKVRSVVGTGATPEEATLNLFEKYHEIFAPKFPPMPR